MLTSFKPPIQYNKHKLTVSAELIADLDLLTTPDPDAEPVFKTIFNPSNKHVSNVLRDMVETYTTDIQYLKDTQQLITDYTENPNKNDLYPDMISALDCIRSDNFIRKHGYVEYSHVAFLNNYEMLLQVLALYTMASPIITLSTPLIIIIVPFIILNTGLRFIDFNSYMDLLKEMGDSHPIIGLITNFGNLSQDQKMYQIGTILLYIFSIYRQIIDCYKFVNNIIALNNKLVKMKEYITSTIQNMRHLSSFTYQLKSYDTFNQVLSKNINDLLTIQGLLDGIKVFKCDIYTLTNLGKMLKTAYLIYSSKDMQDTLYYAVSFNSYMEIMEKINQLHKSGKIHSATLYKHRKPKVQFKKILYPAHVHTTNSVSNNVSIDKNIIITGPNASGKTTLLKSVLLNVLFTQQYGMGFYSRAKLTPFKYLHCYLNIPDTNGRDSLFQAEARRCKHILDSIQTNTDGKHLCIFDELYSGTNPDEAIHSSHHFLKYITKKQNVKWMLTTHFIDLCNKFNTSETIVNLHMHVTDDFKYLYKLKPNISTIKGAYKILEDMKFPQEAIGNSLLSKK
jgi:hypothetical protein